MSEINSMDLSRSRQDEIFAFHQMAKAETVKLKDPKLTALQQAYESAFEAFDVASKQSGGENVFTVPITEQDALCDRIYKGLSSQVSTMEDHFDPGIAEIARQARVILKKYGDPTRLPYLEESGVLHNLVQELEAFDNVSGSDSDSPSEISAEITTHRLAALHVDGWVVRLKAENANFLSLFSDRNKQQASIVTGATKVARQATDTAYRNVVRRINALAEVNGDADYIDVINALNTLIDRQKAILATRATLSEKRKKKEQEENQPTDAGEGK
ncbi:MAG: DUF6261 family protein [Parabacteroides sp.]|nr:DUF6261 family protein [Parabacteroides sp.]